MPPSPRPPAPPAIAKRERNKLEKRARIVAVARRVFAEKGFAGASTHAIAAEAGIASGTLFRYAGSKEDLLLMAFDEVLGDAIAEAEATLPEAGGLLDRALHVYAAVSRCHYVMGEELSAVLLQALMFGGLPEARAAQGARLRLRALVIHLVEAEIRRGAARADLEPGDVANGLFSIFYFQLANWSVGRVDRATLAGRLEAGFELVMQGALIQGAAAMSPSRPARVRRA